MCKEDVRIKRQTSYNSKRAAAGTGDPVCAMPGNPSRVALVLSYVGGIAPTNDTPLSLVSGTADGGIGIAAISTAQPSVVLTIEQIGILLTLPVAVIGTDGNEPEVSLTEVYFTEGLKDL